ncbi:TadE/TadG family type IV pilus assembly protein, partial [Planctomycetota bacterium]
MERITQYKCRMKGTTTVELAFTLPFLLMLVLGALHYGWLFYHLHRVTNATRHAARIGTLVGKSHQDVRDAITAVLGLNDPNWPSYSLNFDTDVVIQDVSIPIGT